MVALVIVVVDEGFDLGFEIARQEVVFQQDAVLQGLMPALNLTLGLRMIHLPLSISCVTGCSWSDCLILVILVWDEPARRGGLRAAPHL